MPDMRSAMNRAGYRDKPRSEGGHPRDQGRRRDERIAMPSLPETYFSADAQDRPCLNTAFVSKGNMDPMSRLRNSWGLRLGAVLNSPGEYPFALDCRLDAGSGGPAARREVEVGLFRRVADRASGHRWMTDAGRAPRGVPGGALVMSPGVRAGRR